MQRNASEIATGRWYYILSALGVAENFLADKHGPCPICGGKDRYRWDDKEGRGTWICNQCGSGDGYELLQRLNHWTFREALDNVRRVVGDAPEATHKPEADTSQRSAIISRTWNESLVIEPGDPAHAYLVSRVGTLEKMPACLRYHPSLAYIHDDGKVTHHPAMIAAVTDKAGKGVTLHRTYLTKDGNKADVPAPKKIMPGKPLSGAAIKLFGYGEYLGVAEGIETALAASKRFGVPVWSCISSGLLEQWAFPDDLKKIIVFGDNDAKYGGQASAYKLAHRVACKGIAVDVCIPENVGEDWADV